MNLPIVNPQRPAVVHSHLKYIHLGFYSVLFVNKNYNRNYECFGFQVRDWFPEILSNCGPTFIFCFLLLFLFLFFDHTIKSLLLNAMIFSTKEWTFNFIHETLAKNQDQWNLKNVQNSFFLSFVNCEMNDCPVPICKIIP